ncbi:MAG TPA: UDP-N-acetylglucosamine 1-carboxyvinyltransferase, partial [Anaerolineales bacterium]|nr:UDP-N-acetylglucosamine 1-carboxyvinyltransferase [Anaerolineales bacterium]
MEKFIIEGGYPLKGTVTPSGNKNAALPLLAACLLTDQPVTLYNVPDIRDVQTMRALLESLGAEIESPAPNTLRIQARQVREADLDPELCRRVRSSILLAGPLVARTGILHLPPP